MELKQIFEMQREFDRKLGWSTYENCRTPEDALKFMEHFVLVMVEELGEISRIRKQYYRDKQSFTVEELKHELMHIFVYFMQACMALNVDLEKEYLKKMEYNEKRFINKKTQRSISYLFLAIARIRNVSFLGVLNSVPFLPSQS